MLIVSTLVISYSIGVGSKAVVGNCASVGISVGISDGVGVVVAVVVVGVGAGGMDGEAPKY